MTLNTRVRNGNGRTASLMQPTKMIMEAVMLWECQITTQEDKPRNGNLSFNKNVHAKIPTLYLVWMIFLYKKHPPTRDKDPTSTVKASSAGLIRLVKESVALQIIGCLRLPES